MTGIEPACPAWEAGAYHWLHRRAGARDALQRPPRRRKSNPTAPPVRSAPPAIAAGPAGTLTRAALRPRHPSRDRRRTGPARPVGTRDGPPSSIDVRLDKFFRMFDNHRYPVIDPSLDQADLTRLVEVDPAEGFVLHPGEFVLGSTLEMVALPDGLAARVEGKSSLGRLGLLTHATAGFVDPGFTGHVTLELWNVATLPIMLWPGMKIGQLAFFRLSSSPRTLTAPRCTARTTRASAGPRPAAASRTSTERTSEQSVTRWAPNPCDTPRAGTSHTSQERTTAAAPANDRRVRPGRLAPAGAGRCPARRLARHRGRRRCRAARPRAEHPEGVVLGAARRRAGQPDAGGLVAHGRAADGAVRVDDRAAGR